MLWAKVPCTLARKRMRVKRVYACSDICNSSVGRMNLSLCFLCRCGSILVDHTSSAIPAFPGFV